MTRGIALQVLFPAGSTELWGRDPFNQNFRGKWIEMAPERLVKRVENAKRWNEVCFGDFDMQMYHSLTHSLTHSGVDTMRGRKR